MKREFKIGDHITAYGNKGIVKDITRCKEYKVDFDGYSIGNGLDIISDIAYEEMKNNGYNMIPTGRTATYYKIKFINGSGLENTTYDNETYGCLDEYTDYDTW